MKPYIITDPGSCHMGRMDLATELVDVSKDCGADAVKFQLFPKCMAGRNVWLDPAMFSDLVMYGKEKRIEVFASVFDEETYEVVANRCASIKFSFSSPIKHLVQNACNDPRLSRVYVSSDTLTRPKIQSDKLLNLYCIPLYPVPYVIDFSTELLHGFDGFSDHTLGIRQAIAAVGAGAAIIEKHLRLDNPACDGCPDGAFAIRPGQLRPLVTTFKYGN